MPADLLNLTKYHVLGVGETTHDYPIAAEPTHTPKACPACRSDTLRGHGRNEQAIRGLPMHGKRAGIYVDTRRWCCATCGKTFMQMLPAVDGKREMTERLVRWMGQQSVAAD